MWALPGFLGLPADWKIVECENLAPFDWQKLPLNSLPDWGRAFNDWIYREKEELNLLLGYSLGGRLALHALIDQPQLWSGAVIVSAHSGFSDERERHLRKERDFEWARRFESEDWNSLMKDWNSQDVFSQDVFSFKRNEWDYQRDVLAQALRGGSIGGQKDLRQQIAALSFPILWITGRRDHRYCELAQSLTFSHSLSRWIAVQGAGHRIPWEKPHCFSQIISRFLHQECHLG